MKPTKLISLPAIFLLMNISSFSQQDNTSTSEPQKENPIVNKKKKLNFFIISRRKKGKLDLATRFNVFRTKTKSLFRRQKFMSIIAEDAEKVSVKMVYWLDKYNARIGTIWFDSHGMYKKGYSLFFVGKDEISYKTLKDSATIFPFLKIAPMTDNESKIVIGSCYGGATYRRLSIDYKDTTRMNGDSLMIGLGNIFSQSTIYGCESWVMTKPGLFLQRPAVAGFPGRKLFHDLCYRPAWENIGKWNEYNALTKTFISVNPVTLDMYGNLKLRIWAYTGHKDAEKYIVKNLNKLEPGLYR